MHIRLRDLAKRFQQQWIFRNLSLDLSAPDSYAITGANGSGKTTLLQVIAGVMPPSQGSITYELNTNKISEEHFYKHISISAPYLELIEEFTLEEFLKFHFKFKPLRPPHTIDQLIDILDLKESQKKFIKNFSSGMKQRVKLALSIYCDTPVILLDEPTTNLDRSGVDWYLKTISQIKTDRLVIISSNQPHEYDFCQHRIRLADYK